MNGHNKKTASTLSHRWANYWFSKKRDGFYTCLTILAAGIYLSGLAVTEYKIGSDWANLSGKLKAAGFITLLGVILLTLIHRNLHGLHSFLGLFLQADHLPKKQIAYVNSFCMTIFLSLTFLTAAIISPVLDPVWAAIAAWFQGLLEPVPLEPPPMEPATRTGPSTQEILELLGEPKPTPSWIKAAEKIFLVIGWLLVAALAYLLLRSLLRSLWGWITKPRQFDDDEKIYLKPVLFLSGDNQPKQAEEKAPGRLRQYFSYNSRIRRLYRKEILSRHGRGSKPQQWASPQELEASVKLKNPQLHQLYEKARYGHTPCTEDDWKTLN